MFILIKPELHNVLWIKNSYRVTSFILCIIYFVFFNNISFLTPPLINNFYFCLAGLKVLPLLNNLRWVLVEVQRSGGRSIKTQRRDIFKHLDLLRASLIFRCERVKTALVGKPWKSPTIKRMSITNSFTIAVCRFYALFESDAHLICMRLHEQTTNKTRSRYSLIFSRF